MRAGTVIVVEGAANLAVLVAKVVVGVSTGSYAILGDALHSATDLANNGFAWAALRIAEQPPDRDHPYGHRKFEPLAVFGLAVLLVVVALELAIRAVGRGEHDVETSGWSLAVMIGVLAVNIAVTLWERRWAERLDSDLLRADANHTLSDVAANLAVIVGWQFAARGYAWLDTVVCIAVAAFVLWLAFRLFGRAIPNLVDEAAHDPVELDRRIGEVPGVLEVRRVRSRRIGKRAFADVVVSVDRRLSTAESHRIADRIERVMHEEFGVQDVTVHVEPADPR